MINSKEITFSNRSKLLEYYTVEEIKEKRKWLKENESKKMINIDGGCDIHSDAWKDNEYYDFMMPIIGDEVHYYYHNRITNEWLYGHIETTILSTFKDDFKENYDILDKKYNLGGLSNNKIDDNCFIYFNHAYVDPYAESLEILSVSLKEDKWVTDRVVTDELEIENLFIESINPSVLPNRTYLQMWEEFWSYYSPDTQLDIKILQHHKRKRLKK